MPASRSRKKARGRTAGATSADRRKAVPVPRKRSSESEIADQVLRLAAAVARRREVLRAAPGAANVAELARLDRAVACMGGVGQRRKLGQALIPLERDAGRFMQVLDAIEDLLWLRRDLNEDLLSGTPEETDFSVRALRHKMADAERLTFFSCVELQAVLASEPVQLALKLIGSREAAVTAMAALYGTSKSLIYRWHANLLPADLRRERDPSF